MNTTLHGALQTFALLTGLEEHVLLAYASEDTTGGYDTGWYMGSLWDVEGRFLYAVIRALGIKRVLEIGVNVGCSTTHMLKAVRANGGRVTSLDINAGSGRDIPDDLRESWEFIPANALDWIVKQKRRKFDLVFEDGPHSTAFTEAVLNGVVRFEPKVVISHDSEHFLVGEAIRKAWDTVYGQHGYTSLLMEPSDCGLAFRVN